MRYMVIIAALAIGADAQALEVCIPPAPKLGGVVISTCFPNTSETPAPKPVTSRKRKPNEPAGDLAALQEELRKCNAAHKQLSEKCTEDVNKCANEREACRSELDRCKVEVNALRRMGGTSSRKTTAQPPPTGRGAPTAKPGSITIKAAPGGAGK